MWGEILNIWWFLFLVPIVFLAISVFRWRESTRKNFADAKLIDQIFPKKTSTKYWFKAISFILGIIFLILSLMDPLWGVEEQKIKKEGIDLVYALDLSTSMNAEDVLPNRLEKAKKLISESINRLGGDRVGLIVFAGEAYVVSPLTNDYSAIQSYLSNAETYLISNQGTDYSNVLVKSAEVFEGVVNTEKILILISDGEEHESYVKNAMEIAKEERIRVITMGVGASKGVPIPIKEGNEIVDYKMNRYGETVMSKLEESTLKDLSAQTEGIYIYVNKIENALNQLHNYFSGVERSVEETATIRDKKHVFQWFLAIALLFIFIDTLTTEHVFFNNKK